MRAVARSGGENVFVGRALPVVGRLDSDRWVRCSAPGGSEGVRVGCAMASGATQCGVWTARAAANWENHELAGLVGSTLDGCGWRSLIIIRQRGLARWSGTWGEMLVVEK